jgi:hypothetical protein
VPTKAPGTLFNSLTGGDASLNVRWLTAQDPVFYEVLNRPIADIAVRQLVLAKAVDNLQLRLGYQALFPFVTQPRVSSGTSEVDVPVGWIWDMHASMPKKWEQLRLAKIKRMSGTNSSTDGYSGWLRLIFTANVENSGTEVAIFKADYRIDSDLTYQTIRLVAVATPEENVVINPGEAETVGGFLIFRTLDINEDRVQDFYDLLAPPTNETDANSDGYFDSPAIYEVSDSNAGGTEVTGDFGLVPLSHGTGLLTDSAWNAIPELNSDLQSWVTAFNYPFDATASRTSTAGIIVPSGLFREFDLTAPAGDQPTGDNTGTYYPVWISRIERVGTGSNHLRIYFATYNITDTEAGGSPSTTPVEFATLDLLRSFTPGEIVEIVPIDDLELEPGTAIEFQQHFGRGHVVLSSLWDKTATDVDNFFDAFDTIVDNPADTEFAQAATRVSSFGLSRVPKYVPTVGQSRAMLGSTSRRTIPIQPGYDNRFVTEQDQGLGNQVDLESQPSITSHQAIDRFAFTGSLVHKIVKLVLKADSLGSDPTFYDVQVLPRLRILFGRDPIFGDQWYNGTRFMTYNGDTWQG